VRIGIVNDMPGVAALLQRVVASIRPIGRLDRARRRRARGALREGHAGPDPDGHDDAGHGRRRDHAPHHGQHPVRHPHRHRQHSDDRRPIFEAMGHGALDAIDSPLLGAGKIEERAAPLLAKIATISRLVADRRGRRRDAEPGAGVRTRPATTRLVRDRRLRRRPGRAGHPPARSPGDFPAAVVIVQHVDEQFAAGMATWLNQSTALPVRVALEGDRPAVGEVLLASTSDHLALKTADRVGYTANPVDYAYRPRSTCSSTPPAGSGGARHRRRAVTGMDVTGRFGLKALRDAGHHTIAQDQATSAVYGMPKAAATINAPWRSCQRTDCGEAHRAGRVQALTAGFSAVRARSRGIRRPAGPGRAAPSHRAARRRGSTA
jgi:hypothetical protein